MQYPCEKDTFEKTEDKVCVLKTRNGLPLKHQCVSTPPPACVRAGLGVLDGHHLQGHLVHTREQIVQSISTVAKALLPQRPR